MEEEVGGARNRDQSASYAHYSGIYILSIRLFLFNLLLVNLVSF